MAEQQTIRHGLERISQWAKNYYQGDVEFIPGLSMTEIERIVKNFPFKVPEEIIEFHATGHASMFLSPYPNSFINLEDSARDCFACGFGENNYLKYDDPSSMAEWCEINVAYGSGKELYQMRCYRHETSSSPVYIREVAAEPYVYASSLTNSILATAECYESGAYYPILVKDDGEYGDFYAVDVDLKKAEPIFKKYNPQQLDFWLDLHRYEESYFKVQN